MLDQEGDRASELAADREASLFGLVLTSQLSHQQSLAAGARR
jgi:hypothetical protein